MFENKILMNIIDNNKIDKFGAYGGYSDNVGLIKFIAAIMVIMYHAFVLSTGSMADEWLIVLSRNQYTMGRLAVAILFYYSGLLTMRSFSGEVNAKIYFGKKIKRIFPALLTVVLICAFVLGPVVSSYSLIDYYTSGDTYKYLLNSVFILVHNLPGVFSDNIYGATVNGALWTMPLEVICYIAVYCMYKCKFFRRIPMFIITILTYGIVLFITAMSHYTSVDKLVTIYITIGMFMMGVIYYYYRNRIPMTFFLFAISLAVVIVFCSYKYTLLGMFIGMPYILSYLGFAILRVPHWLGSTGRLSYGIYLCGYPIQQTVVNFYGGYMNPYVNMALAIPLSIICGYLIHRFVEMRFV